MLAQRVGGGGRRVLIALGGVATAEKYIIIEYGTELMRAFEP